MEALGAITGLIGAGLQAQAQHDNLMFQYAHFNWEKERADKQDWMAGAARSDQYGNVTSYDPVLNKWSVNLSPMQAEISNDQQKEQLLQLTKDIPAARKVKEAVQQRAYEAKEPFLKASLGYQFDQPESEGAIRSDLTGLLARNEMQRTKADQALVMRQAARLGRGADATKIINSADQSLGNAANVQNRMLQARNEALKEFAGRQQLHEAQWGAPMKIWGDYMSQGGDIPGVPKGALTDTSGQQQAAMLQAFNQGTARVGGAFDSLASAAGKSPDLSGIAKSLASIGKGSKNSKGQDDGTSYGSDGGYNLGTMYDWQKGIDSSRQDWGLSDSGDSVF